MSRKPRAKTKVPPQKEVTPKRWRDVTQYFDTADDEVSGLNMLSNGIRNNLKPTNVLERLWCDDIIAIAWQAHKLRELKIYIVFDGARRDAVTRLKLADQIDPRKDTNDDPGYELQAMAYAAGFDDTGEIEDKVRAAGGLASYRYEAGYLERANELENVDRLIFAHEKRRDELIDRFEKRRANSAQ